MQHHEGTIRIKWNIMHKQLVLVQINNEIFKVYKKNCLKSVFGVATKSCNKCCYMMWHGIKLFLNVCLWKRVPYCLYAQLKFIFWSCKTWIKSKMPTNQFPHVLNRQHIWRIRRPRKKLHALGWTEVSNSLWNMWMCIVLLKDSSRNEGKERFWAVGFTNVPVDIKITLNL